jgi:hypothetical protein
MQMKIITAVIAATLVTIISSLAAFHFANADPSQSSPPVQPHSKQDAMNDVITGGLQLANQSSQMWQQMHPSEQPKTANALNSHNNKFDNHSPSIIAQLPF